MFAKRWDTRMYTNMFSHTAINKHYSICTTVLVNSCAMNIRKQRQTNEHCAYVGLTQAHLDEN